jgi:outer membrane murein-binding lipoprotein Lpp
LEFIMTLTKRITLAAVLASLAIWGCSSVSMEDIAKDQAKADKIRAKAEAERLSRRQSAMSDEIDATPKWATQVPMNDGVGFYAVGQGDSDSLRVSMDRARLNGEFGLAERLSGAVSGLAQQRDKDGLMGRQEDYKRLIDNLVAEVPVVGYEVVRQESKPIQGRFHSYVLVRLPFDSINRVLHEQEAKSHDAEIKKDFDALAERIDKLREEAKARTAPDMVVPLTPPSP